MQVTRQNCADIRVAHHVGEPGLVSKFDEDREVEHARHRRVMQYEHGSERRGGLEFAAEPFELFMADLA